MSTIKTSRRRRLFVSRSTTAPSDTSRSVQLSNDAEIGEQADKSWLSSTFAWALASSVALWAAFPPFGWWPLAWVAPVGWLALVRRDTLAGRRPYLQLWAAGFIHCMALYYFIPFPHWALWFGWVALALYLGAYLPIFVGLTRVAVHQLRISMVLAAPIVWVGLELARGHLWSGFSIALLGHSQVTLPIVIQIADLCGAYSVSFLLMLVAACLTQMLPLQHRRFAWWPSLAMFAAITATLIYGWQRLNESNSAKDDPRVARVALVQGSIDTVFDLSPDEAERRSLEDFKQYRDLTMKAISSYPDLDLIVWPESKFPVPDMLYADGIDPRQHLDEQTTRDIEDTRAEFAQVVQLATGRNPADPPAEFKLLLGAHSIRLGPDGSEHLNAALTIDPTGGVESRYFKMHRVPFGEYILLDEFFPWIYQWTPLPGALTAGDRPTSFDVSGLQMAPNICFESTVPHLIRRQIQQLAKAGARPDVLINITDDGWFLGSSCLDHHLACSTMRAVENRTPVLVAANTGFSAWIDGNGRLLKKGPRRAEQVLYAEVQPDNRHSLYSWTGDGPVGGCLAFCVLVGAFGTVQRWRKQRRTEN